MLTSESDFEEHTAFERYALDRIAPFFPPESGGIRIRYQGPDSVAATVNVSVSDMWGGQSEHHLDRTDVYPLAFGAGWKVLDFLIELCLYNQGVPPDRNGAEYTIRLKTGHVRSGNLVGPTIFKASVWAAITHLYAATEVFRASLVHRKLQVDPTTKDMIASDVGTRHPPLTVVQQVAFCGVAVGVAEAVIKRQLTNRQERQLKARLDQLAPHHRRNSFGAESETGLIPVLEVSAVPASDNRLKLDLQDFRRVASSAVSGRKTFDLEVDLPDRRKLAAYLEETPNRRVAVSLDEDLPAWLRWI